MKIEEMLHALSNYPPNATLKGADGIYGYNIMIRDDDSFFGKGYSFAIDSNNIIFNLYEHILDENGEGIEDADPDSEYNQWLSAKTPIVTNYEFMNFIDKFPTKWDILIKMWSRGNYLVKSLVFYAPDNFIILHDKGELEEIYVYNYKTFNEDLITLRRK